MELNQRESAVVAALASGAGPWSAPASISRAARVRSRRVLDRLCGKGLIERWIGDGNGYTFKTPRYTFTPLGAYLFDYRLEEEVDGKPRWIPGLESQPTRPLRSRWAGMGQLHWPETIADHRPGPAQYLLDVESRKTTTNPDAAAQLWNQPIPATPRRRGRA